MPIYRKAMSFSISLELANRHQLQNQQVLVGVSTLLASTVGRLAQCLIIHIANSSELASRKPFFTICPCSRPQEHEVHQHLTFGNSSPYFLCPTACNQSPDCSAALLRISWPAISLSSAWCAVAVGTHNQGRAACATQTSYGLLSWWP